MKSLGVDLVKTTSLGSLRKVQLKVENSYDRKKIYEQEPDYIWSNFCLTHLF
jgi:hypothetical protein